MVPALIRVGRPRKSLGARICLTYRRARRAEVANPPCAYHLA